ncbi:ankyrin repeat domain-containing protein [Pseudoxanthomonas dokdonensis]|uniref:Uncharacterized protein n=1 Tax=Pseudoxanthomonas dokdonensis TaxID=344882 RepID=A0A0R0D2J9_9GAMM|nr:ankyrin repeat domain-containing protein [Pseudoxanthomonas dokdonensis]KRG71592.1 hypothetical protein ABB29_02175 [Pseudoxanthomonas dokdonensis]
MSVFKAIKLRACLAIVLLALAPVLRAQDVEGFIEQVALKRYHVEPGEVTRARAGDGYTYSVFGSRWGFLNRYDEHGKRIWRSPPFRVDICRSHALLGSWGPADDGYYQLETGLEQNLPRLHCPDGLILEWLLLPDHSLVGMKVQANPGADAPHGDLVQPTVTWHLLASASASAAEDVTRQIMAQWRKQPLWIWSAGMKQVLSPRQVKIRVEPPASPPLLRQRYQRALKLWQRPRAGIDSAQRAGESLAALEPELFRIDPRSLPDTDIVMLNDIGFWLQQQGGCGSSNDAIALLENVLQRDPGRTPAYLNLAQAMQGAQHCPLNLGNKVGMQENARQYCQRQGIDNIPGNIAMQLADMLEVKALDAQTCRPRMSLFNAVQTKDLAALQQALAAHPQDLQQTNADGWLVLGVAVASDWLDGAAALLEAGADPDITVPHAADPDGYTSSPLERAINNGNREMVDLLLKQDVELNPVVGRQPLLVAAGQRSDPARQADDTAIVRDLLQAGAHRYGIGKIDGDRNTVLMKVASSGNLASARLLLEQAKPADINAVNNDGRNALYEVPASRPGDVAMWRLLLAHGANINQQDRSGRTPLMNLFEVYRRDPAIVASMLAQALAQHPDLELTDADEGRRLLDYAVAAGNEAAVRLLLEAGAERCQPYNSDRSSAQDLAARIKSLSYPPQCQQGPAACPPLATLQRIALLLDCPTSATAGSP